MFNGRDVETEENEHITNQGGGIRLFINYLRTAAKMFVEEAPLWWWMLFAFLMGGLIF